MFTLKITDSVHYKGSLINCLLNGYGLDEFVVLNHKGFVFTFHHVILNKEYESNPDKSYDTDFFFCIERILTRKELDKFKIKFRSIK